MSSERHFRWSSHTLVEVEEIDPVEYVIHAADSLLVSDGRAFALNLHRERMREAVTTTLAGTELQELGEFDAFWRAACAMIPTDGEWFPRFELRSVSASASACASASSKSHFAFRNRPAPELTRAVTLVTHSGPDPRRAPSVKGPDIARLAAVRNGAQMHGADDAVFTTSDGHIVDCATNALVWWRGEALCAPPGQSDDIAFARVNSITAQSLIGLASALGLETRTERSTPADLDGCEVWALNALHGIRMVTGWVNGPELAERPGRLKAWRDRRRALRTPIGDFAQ